MSGKALFLDRDGVINVDCEYLHRIEDCEFVPGIFDLCRWFADRLYALIIVTNQAGISRGYYSLLDMQRLHEHIAREFEKRGAPLAATHFCPHHPSKDGECDCRKPAPGMILAARKELGLDLGGSVLIGDKESDARAGVAAGVGHNYLLRGAYPIPDNTVADAIFDSLDALLRHEKVRHAKDKC